MRFLFVSYTFPRDLYTSVHGIFKRMNMFIDAIKLIGTIEMLFYVPMSMEISSKSVEHWEQTLSEYWDTKIKLNLCHRFEHKTKLSYWQRYGLSALFFFKQPKYMQTSMPYQVKAFETCLQRKPSAIFAHRLNAMCPILITKKNIPPVFFDLDDIEHVAFYRKISQPPEHTLYRLLYLQLPALKRGERKALNIARCTFVCSEHDRDYLTKLWKFSSVVTAPNAVIIPQKNHIVEELSILFIGSYVYEPNKNAVEFFLDKIWHLIQKKVPQAHLIIAGSYPERIKHFTQNPAGVEFTGFVDDIQQLYKRSRIICCPILTGGGTRVKIIEAAAYEKPIVTTAIGLEGIKMSDGKEVLIRDDAESFSKACVQLLKDRSLCMQLGKAARKVAEKEYNRKKVIEKIQDHILSAFN